MTKNKDAQTRFSLSLREFAAEIGPAALQVQKKLAVDGLAGVVQKSPVDTGRFRGNWQLGPAEAATPIERLDASSRGAPPSAAVVAAEVGKLSTLQPFSTVFLSNALPYAEELENGHSGQAPQGVLGLTVLELQAQLESLRE